MQVIVNPGTGPAHGATEQHAAGNMAVGRSIEIQMPGLPVERVRYMGETGQNIWDFPRLYVDDSSWIWQFALSVCKPDDED
jgi:hypothetical protein